MPEYIEYYIPISIFKENGVVYDYYKFFGIIENIRGISTVHVEPDMKNRSESIVVFRIKTIYDYEDIIEEVLNKLQKVYQFIEIKRKPY